jgi:hypothetical protein
MAESQVYYICATLYGLLSLIAAAPSTRPTSPTAFAWKMFAFIYGIGTVLCLGVDKFVIVKNLPARLTNVPSFILGIAFCLIIFTRCLIIRLMFLRSTTFDFKSIFTSPVWLTVFATPLILFVAPSTIPLMYLAFFASSVAIPFFGLYGKYIGSPYISKYTLAYIITYAVNIFITLYMKFSLGMSTDIGECINVLIHVLLLLGVREMDAVATSAKAE